MKTRIYLTALMLCTVTLFNGCKKEGPPGPAGADGNANVQSSSITFSNWYWDNTNYFDYSNFTWAAITADIVNNGAVLAYVNTSNGWAALPRTIYPNTTYSESQRFYYDIGTFKIVVQDSDLTTASPGTWTIKVVAIAASARMANPDLNWDNYEAVKERFNLPD